MKTNNDIQKLKDKSFIIKSVVPKEEIKTEYNNVLLSIQKNYKQKGFRPGKVPLTIIEQESDPKAIMEEVLSRCLSKNYSDEIKKNDLHPIIDPKVKVITTPVNYETDWEVEYESCEMPEVKINNSAFEEIKKMEDRNIEKILDLLVQKSDIIIPEILKEKEKEWKINLVIDKIAQDQNIQVSTDEIKADIQENPALAQNINLTFYLYRQQKVIDYLKNLK